MPRFLWARVIESVGTYESKERLPQQHRELRIDRSLLGLYALPHKWLYVSATIISLHWMTNLLGQILSIVFLLVDGVTSVSRKGQSHMCSCFIKKLIGCFRCEYVSPGEPHIKWNCVKISDKATVSGSPSRKLGSIFRRNLAGLQPWSVGTVKANAGSAR